MKNILRTSVFSLLFFAAASCTENDKDPVVSPHAFELRAPAAMTPVVLSPQNSATVVAALEWDKSDNGIAAVPSYSIEIASHTDTDFAHAITLNSGNNIDISTGLLAYSLTEAELNAVVSQLTGTVCGSPTAVDIRVRSQLGIVANNAFIQYSNVIPLTVSTFSAALPLMSFAMTPAGAATAPKMAASSIYTMDYEGYMYLLPGDYFFYRGDACNSFGTPTSYGDDGGGSFDTLMVGGSAYTINTAGNYRVRANLTTMKYVVTPISNFGIIGLAKTVFTGVSNNPVFVYNSATNVYSSPAPIKLHGGKTFRFRANNSNVISLARFDPTKTGDFYAGPTMSYDGPEILVPGLVDAFYNITLDVSNPRNYTYTLTLN